jgi:hypothetical protein
MSRQFRRRKQANQPPSMTKSATPASAIVGTSGRTDQREVPVKASGQPAD